MDCPRARSLQHKVSLLTHLSLCVLAPWREILLSALACCHHYRLRKPLIVSASFSPIPSTLPISSTDALRRRSTEPTHFKSACLRLSLTPGQSSSTLSAIRFFISN